MEKTGKFFHRTDADVDPSMFANSSDSGYHVSAMQPTASRRKCCSIGNVWTDHERTWHDGKELSVPSVVAQRDDEATERRDKFYLYRVGRLKAAASSWDACPAFYEDEEEEEEEE